LLFVPFFCLHAQRKLFYTNCFHNPKTCFTFAPNLFIEYRMFAIIDVETTGGSARWERITEIAIVLHDGQVVVDTFATLINPERSIPWNITQLTGITDEMVANAPRFFEVARRIVEMTEGAVFVAHNVQFDYGFVREEFNRLGYMYTRRQLCTVRLARKVFPGLPGYSLSKLKAHFGIAAERSHRALDDTLATVHILERILAARDGESSLKAFINHGVKETKLPPQISLDRLHALPEACGVYYFHDAAGQVVYVGKSLNIRKRIFEHFADPSPKGEQLRQSVADLSCEVTGSELVALLLESAEIKRLQPRINRAQRAQQFQGAIYTHTDPQGYIRFCAGKNPAKGIKGMDKIAEYPKMGSSVGHLEALMYRFELCGKLCHFDSSVFACFRHAIKQCHGACIGFEAPEDYNIRAEAAMRLIKRGLEGSFLITEPGRTPEEQAIVGVLDGRFAGYAFFEKAFMSGADADVWDVLKRPGPDPEAERIIHNYKTVRGRAVKTAQ
jgi:DNA polymerase-3 subunit epsilon